MILWSFDAHAVFLQELARLYVHLHRTEFSTSHDCFDPWRSVWPAQDSTSNFEITPYSSSLNRYTIQILKSTFLAIRVSWYQFINIRSHALILLISSWLLKKRESGSLVERMDLIGENVQLQRSYKGFKEELVKLNRAYSSNLAMCS